MMTILMIFPFDLIDFFNALSRFKMASDYDFINEHLGGHDEDGLPNFMSDPGFNDDGDEEMDDYVETLDDAKAGPKSKG